MSKTKTYSIEKLMHWRKEDEGGGGIFCLAPLSWTIYIVPTIAQEVCLSYKRGNDQRGVKYSTSIKER